MTAEDFLVEAQNSISSDPKSRLGSKSKQWLESEESSIDIHSHFMTKESICGSEILIRLIDWADHPDRKLDDIIDLIYQWNIDNDFDDILHVLNKESMEQVLDYYQSSFNPAPFTLAAALMMDLRFGWKSSPKKDFYSQARELNLLAKERELLPFLALDPRGVDDTGEYYNLFLECFGPGGFFQGLKCYPSLGFLPSDPRNMVFFEICQSKGIPVTTHCGGTTLGTYQRAIELYGKAYARAWGFFPLGQKYKNWYGKIIRGGKNKKSEFLNHPNHWVPVLEKFPELKLNLAHCGGNDHWKKFTRKGKNPRLEAIQKIMETYPNVYSDIAGIPLEADLLDSYLNQNKYPLLRERGLYGSDFWVNLTSGNFKESIQAYKGVEPTQRNKLEKENPKRFLWGD